MLLFGCLILPVEPKFKFRLFLVNKVLLMWIWKDKHTLFGNQFQ